MKRRWKEFMLHGRFTWWLIDRGRYVRATISTMWKDGGITFLASVRLKKAGEQDAEAMSFDCLEDAKRWVGKLCPPPDRSDLFTVDVFR